MQLHCCDWCKCGTCYIRLSSCKWRHVHVLHIWCTNPPWKLWHSCPAEWLRARAKKWRAQNTRCSRKNQNENALRLVWRTIHTALHIIIIIVRLSHLIFRPTDARLLLSLVLERFVCICALMYSIECSACTTTWSSPPVPSFVHSLRFPWASGAHSVHSIHQNEFNFEWSQAGVSASNEKC